MAGAETSEEITLYEWSASWARWQGAPEALGSLAEYIKNALERSFPNREVWELHSWTTPTRSVGPASVESLVLELRARRRDITIVELHVTVQGDDLASFDGPHPKWVEPAPESGSGPFQVRTEAVSPPAKLTATFGASRGVSLTLLARGGFGARIFDGVCAQIAVHASERSHGPEWLLPRFELSEGERPRWKILLGRAVATVSFVGALAGIAALIMA
jgi:hypothetical protein